MRYSKRRLDSSANERCREEVIADQVANDLPSIVIDYLEFRDKLQKGRVFFDKTEEIYRVLE